MKSSLLIAVLLIALPACAPKKKVKYVENPYDNSGNDARFADIEQRLSWLESSAASTIAQLSVNSASIVNLQSQLSSEVLSLQADITLVQSQIAAIPNNSQQLQDLQDRLLQLEQDFSAALEDGGEAYADILAKIAAIKGSNTTLQSSVNSLIAQMEQLQSQDKIVEFIDPCPSVQSSGYKEILLKSSSGKLIAYFESGATRFLTELVPGNYRTTDSRSCSFTVNSDSSVTHVQAPVVSYPAGATHKLNLCSESIYKVPGGINYKGTFYSGSFNMTNCGVVTSNNSVEHISVAGCNFNNVSSLQTGASVGNGCSVEKL